MTAATEQRGGAVMRSQLQGRLAGLHEEYGRGQQVLADLDARRTSVHDSMQRIAGAIQVLEELLADDGSAQALAADD